MASFLANKTKSESPKSTPNKQEKETLKSSQPPPKSTNRSGNEVVGQLNDIKEKMKQFDDRMKKLVGWETYQRHRESIKSFSKISSMNHTCSTGMLRPHILVDEVNLDCKKQYKVIVLVTKF